MSNISKPSISIVGRKTISVNPVPGAKQYRLYKVIHRLVTNFTSKDKLAIVTSDNKAFDIGGINLLKGSIKYTKTSPYSLTPDAADSNKYLLDITADVVAGETYIISCTTDGLWSQHLVSGDRYCTLWIASYAFANRSHRSFTGDGTETGRKSWTFVADRTETKTIRVNAYGAGNSTVNFWDFKLENG